MQYTHFADERLPIISSGIEVSYPNLFNGLTLIDWSKDSNKVLIKEKVGSTINGIYDTNLYLYFLPTDISSSKLIKLDGFKENIFSFYSNYNNIQLQVLRYSIEPLGFSAKNDNMIVARVYVYDQKKEKLFLGIWGYDIENKQTMLISEENIPYSVSINSLVLRQIP